MNKNLSKFKLIAFVTSVASVTSLVIFFSLIPPGHSQRKGTCFRVARAWVHLSTGSGFEEESSVNTFECFALAQRWLTGDFNSDGKVDLVNVYGRNGDARAWAHLSNGSGFEYESSFNTFAGFWESQRWL
ncbi:hypothetical protein KR51_00006710, partial [Rubidibacter lacunae KORDI 51-2]